MKTSYRLAISLSLGLLIAMVPAAARAQLSCPTVVTVDSCPFAAVGDTSAGSNTISHYLGCSDLYTYAGPDVAYRMTLAVETHLAVALLSSFDAALAILPVAAGDCQPDGCLAGADLVFSAGTEQLRHILLPAGTYDIVVDGYDGDGAGSYTIDVACEHCTDADHDGYFAYDAASCPSGDDCCDTGSESAIGCSVDSAGFMAPGLAEICGDGIDQNCDGHDVACVDQCPAAATLACGATVSGDTSGGPSNIDDYSCAAWTLPGPEAYSQFTLSEAGAVTISISTAAGHDWDAGFVVLSTWQGFCDPNNCIARGGNMEGSIDVPVMVELPAGTYYVVVESASGNSVGPYTVALDCGGCADVDGDGYVGHDAVTCTTGTDCCDTGSETSLGCSANTAASIHPGALDFFDDGIDSNCDGLDSCQDADNDGFPAASCGGSDCCDSGSESSPGCAVQNAASINPGAVEVCGNAVDENCDGVAVTSCPDCHSATTLTCPSGSGQITTTGTTGSVDDYCGYGSNMWTGPERIFAVTPTADSALTFSIDYDPASTTGSHIFDLFALDSFGVANTCNPGSCVEQSTSGGSGSESVLFVGLQGRTYYFAVDERTGQSGSFNYRLACATERRTSSISIGCGGTVNGDNSAETNGINAYLGLPYAMPAPEAVYRYSPTVDALASFTLAFDPAVDLALIATEADASGNCLPSRVVGFGDQDQAQGAPGEETVAFTAHGGTIYCLLVDGWLASERGPFALAAGCSIQCASGETMCDDRVCFNLDSDESHCGGCLHNCNSDEICVAGACRSTTDGGVADSAETDSTEADAAVNDAAVPDADSHDSARRDAGVADHATADSTIPATDGAVAGGDDAPSGGCGCTAANGGRNASQGLLLALLAMGVFVGRRRNTHAR